MGSKPRAAEYRPSETEKQQAAIAQADQDFFEQSYDPLLRQMRDESLKTDTASTLRGRAQADTMQALTAEGPNLGTISRVDTAANRASGAVANMLQANVLAKDVKNQQQADAGDALAKASKLARSEDLNRASAALSRSVNIMGNIGKLGSAAIQKGMDSGGFSFNP